MFSSPAPLLRLSVAIVSANVFQLTLLKTHWHSLNSHAAAYFASVLIVNYSSLFTAGKNRLRYFFVHATNLFKLWANSSMQIAVTFMADCRRNPWFRRQSACEKRVWSFEQGDPGNKVILETRGVGWDPKSCDTRPWVFRFHSWLVGREERAKFPTGLQLVRDSTCLYQSLTLARAWLFKILLEQPLTFEPNTALLHCHSLWPLNSSNTPSICADYGFIQQKHSQIFCGHTIRFLYI